MSYKVKEIEYKGYTVGIYVDESPSNPRDDDNMGHMLFLDDRNYPCGDETISKNSLYIEVEIGEDDYEEKEVGLIEYVEKTRDAVLAIPIDFYSYSSSDGHIKESSDYDNPDGVIYMTQEELDKDYAKTNYTQQQKLDHATSVLLAEIEIYNQYMNGEVYGYIIHDVEDKNTIDSCWGFYGLDVQKNGMAWYYEDIIDGLVDDKRWHDFLMRHGECPFCNAVPLRLVNHMPGVSVADFDGVNYVGDEFVPQGKMLYLCPECDGVIAEAEEKASAFIKAGYFFVKGVKLE